MYGARILFLQEQIKDIIIIRKLGLYRPAVNLGLCGFSRGLSRTAANHSDSTPRRNRRGPRRGPFSSVFVWDTLADWMTLGRALRITLREVRGGVASPLRLSFRHKMPPQSKSSSSALMMMPFRSPLARVRMPSYDATASRGWRQARGPERGEESCRRASSSPRRMAGTTQRSHTSFISLIASKCRGPAVWTRNPLRICPLFSSAEPVHAHT